jgi:hypothetical protein
LNRSHVLALLAFILSSSALAQAGPSSPEARRDEIAKVAEMLADPDPLMRLTNMEAIVKSGDTLKLQVALRIALTGEDEDLRGLALRAYLASRKEITFEVTLPSNIRAQLDASRSDPIAERAFRAKYPYVVYLAQYAERFQLTFPDYAFAQDHGTAHSFPNTGEFAITGERLAVKLRLNNWGECYVDFSPKGQVFSGTLACGSWPQLAITAPSF